MIIENKSIFFFTFWYKKIIFFYNNNLYRLQQLIVSKYEAMLKILCHEINILWVARRENETITLELSFLKIINH